MVTFAYLTGCRVNSEVLTLQWHQIDLRAGVVRLDPVPFHLTSNARRFATSFVLVSLSAWR